MSSLILKLGTSWEGLVCITPLLPDSWGNNIRFQLNNRLEGP